jgi:DNA-binding beta-propeller fold protein YncE
MKRTLILAGLAVILCAGRLVRSQVRAASHTSHEVLKQIAAFDLPGPIGKRFDYLTIDPDDHYLISAHLAAGQTYVIDLRADKVVATVKDTPGAEGVEYASEEKKFYTSNAGDNTIGVVDLRQMKVVKKLPTEKKPDGSAYAAPFHKLYVSDERGKAEAIVDVTKDEIIKTLHFDSETGMPQYDPIARRVYVNLQDQDIFAVIDPATDEVAGRYPVGKCKGNHGMALDPEHHRAFLSCEENNLMTVFDLDKREPIAIFHWLTAPTSSSSIQVSGEFMPLATVAPSLSFIKTIPTTTARLRTSKFSMQCIVLPSIRKRIACTHPSKRKMGSRWQG